MTSALQLKFEVQGLSEGEAMPVIEDFVAGDDWRDEILFSDGSSAHIEFVSDEMADAARCVVHCLDTEGNRPKPVVRAKFTCDYLPDGTYVEAYFDGEIFGGAPLPYLTYNDVVGMKSLLVDMEIHVRKEAFCRGGKTFFEVLPPGYEWGEHTTVGASFLDLGDCVVSVYAFIRGGWNWRPFFT